MPSLYLARLSSSERADLLKKLHDLQNRKCFICEEAIDLVLHGENLDIDHVIPTSVNGKDDESNFAVTHSSCNRSKQASNLALARVLHRFKRIADQTQEENRNPNLDDILRVQNGSQHNATFSVSANTIKFSFPHIGRNEVIELPLYEDKLSGFKYFFSTFPIEYLHHDERINPRSIGKNLSQLIAEFYEKRPQLHIALGWIESNGSTASPVRIFDGQHKTAAQVMLGVKDIPVRVFVNPNKDVLLTANTNAGTTLRQVAFDKSVQRHLGSTLYLDRVNRYRADLGLDDENLNFSERDLVKYFKGESREMRRYILDAVRDWITHNPDNKLKEYVEFAGKGKDRPLSYSTLEKTFYSLFLFQDLLDTPLAQELESGNNPRTLEKEQSLQLMNLIAEEIFIDKFDFDVGIDRIEKKFQDGEPLPLPHVRCYRLAREEIMFNWLALIKQVIHNHFVTVGKKFTPERLFHYRFSDQLWANIRNFVKNLCDLPVWVNREISTTVFGGKQNHDYWAKIFETGTTPQGTKVLAEPINVLNMIQRKEG